MTYKEFEAELKYFDEPWTYNSEKLEEVINACIQLRQAYSSNGSIECPFCNIFLNITGCDTCIWTLFTRNTCSDEYDYFMESVITYSYAIPSISEVRAHCELPQEYYNHYYTTLDLSYEEFQDLIEEVEIALESWIKKRITELDEWIALLQKHLEVIKQEKGE